MREDSSQDTGPRESGGDPGSLDVVLAAAPPQGSHWKEMSKDVQFATGEPPRKGASVCAIVG